MIVQKNAPAWGFKKHMRAKAKALGRVMRTGAAAIATCLLVGTAPLGASTLVDEAVLDRIFSQDSFGDAPINVRLLPTINIESNRLRRVDLFFKGGGFVPGPLEIIRNEPKELFDMGTEGPVLDFFLVDEINFGFFRPAGVAENLEENNFLEPVFGNGLIVDRDFNFGIDRELIVAHEIGHTLGLRHPDDPQPPFFSPPTGFFPPNLMNSMFSGSELLTEAQVAQIMLSDNVQGDAATGFFIEVQQYDVVAEPVVVTPVPVPLPASAPLFVAGFALLGWIGRRR